VFTVFLLYWFTKSHFFSPFKIDLQVKKKGGVFMATNYTHTNVTKNGVDLSIIKTPGWNIVMGGLKQAGTLASPVGYYGINGGFFEYSGQPNYQNGANTKYIALNNGKGIYGNGAYDGFENRMGRACLSYNSSTSKLVWKGQYVESANDLGANDRYWAQGGPSFKFGLKDGLWEDVLKSEIKPENFDPSSAYQAAICANLDTKYVYLIVSKTKAKVSSFRKALHDYLVVPNTATSEHAYIVGILLDSGGSASLRCAEDSFQATSSTRKLSQIIALRDTN
jgi:hypothetical protein